MLSLLWTIQTLLFCINKVKKIISDKKKNALARTKLELAATRWKDWLDSNNHDIPVPDHVIQRLARVGGIPLFVKNTRDDSSGVWTIIKDIGAGPSADNTPALCPMTMYCLYCVRLPRNLCSKNCCVNKLSYTYV